MTEKLLYNYNYFDKNYHKDKFIINFDNINNIESNILDLTSPDDLVIFDHSKDRNFYALPQKPYIYNEIEDDFEDLLF